MDQNLLIRYFLDSDKGESEALDIQIFENEICCLIGPTNSGKTGLMRQLAGIEFPEVGDLTILGGDPRQMKFEDYQEQRLAVGYVTAKNNLISNMTLMQNITLAPLYHRTDTRTNVEKRAISLCRTIGLDCSLNLLPSAYSEHELRLANIVRSLIPQPKLLFVEDAFGGGDVATQKSLLDIYKELISFDLVTLIISTHHLPIAAECAENFIFVSENQTLSMGSWDKLLQNPNPDVRQYLSHFDMRGSLI